MLVIFVDRYKDIGKDRILNTRKRQLVIIMMSTLQNLNMFFPIFFNNFVNNVVIINNYIKRIKSVYTNLEKQK